MSQGKLNGFQVVGLLGLAGLVAYRVTRPAAPASSIATVPARASRGRGVRPVGAADEPQASGLLLSAVRAGSYERPRWSVVRWDGLLVQVWADALRAPVDGALLRLPVSYAETIEIAQTIDRGNLVTPTASLASAIYQASDRLVYHGLVLKPEDSRRMRSLAFCKAFNADIGAQIEAKGSKDLLHFGAWKLWVLSPRLVEKAHDAPTEPAAVNFGGWNAAGQPIQPESTWHVYPHDDYSQCLTLVSRWATDETTGERVDLLDRFEQRDHVPAAYTAPWRT